MEINLEVLEDLASQYYPFAFALTPDDLMAAQLLIDAVTKSAVMIRDQKNHDEVFLLDRRDIELILAKNIYELSLKRSAHFADHHQGHEAEEAFYTLSVSERAALFLKDKMKLTQKDMTSILDERYENILSLIHSGRAKLLSSNPVGGHSAS